MLRRFNFFLSSEATLGASRSAWEDPNDVASGKSADADTVDALAELPPLVGVSGGGSPYLALADAGGGVALVDKEMQVVSYTQAHKKKVNLVHQLKSRPVLVTIGDGPTEADKATCATVDSQIKFWSISSSHKGDGGNVQAVAPRLLRSFVLGQVLAKEKNKPYWVGEGTKDGAARAENPLITCMEITEDLQQMALGFSNGQVLLIRSDPFFNVNPSMFTGAAGSEVQKLTKSINSKSSGGLLSMSPSSSLKGSNLLLEKGHTYTTLQTFKHVGKSQVTGLGFTDRVEDASRWLWVATDKDLRSYRTNVILNPGQAGTTRRTSFSQKSARLGEVESGTELDMEGCKLGCCTTAKPPLAAPTMAPQQSFTTMLKDGSSVGGIAEGREGSSFEQPNKRRHQRQEKFVLAKSDRVEYYSPEDPGNVYAVTGNKKLVSWFRNYLVVVTHDTAAAFVSSEAGVGSSGNNPINGISNGATPSSSRDGVKASDVIQLYDFRNKFIALNFSLRHYGDTNIERAGAVSFVASQWNRLIVFTSTKKVFVFKEKDTQTKLEDLFRRNLFATSISLAHSSGCSDVQILEIHKMYGDHLYAKGSFDEAIAQYCRTVGYIEPSYVIRRFLDSQRIENLTAYLEALHMHADVKPTGDHTTLLLNCYTKQKNEKKLQAFVENPEITKGIDVNAAVTVLRAAQYFDQALKLAEEHKKHDLFLSVLIEEICKYHDALAYMRKLPIEQASVYLQEYGKILLSALPEETTDAIVILCCHPGEWAVTDESAEATGGEKEEEDRATSEGGGRTEAEHYINLFVDHPKHLFRFLQCVVEGDQQFVSSRTSSPLVWNTFLELVIRQTVAKNEPDAAKRGEAEQQALAVLKSPSANYDSHHALVLVQEFEFKKGQLFLYEKLQMYHMLIQHYMEEGDSSSILAKCKTYGAKDPNLWIQVLMHFAQLEHSGVEREIQEVLHHIERLRVLPPLVVVEVLSANKHIPLSTIRPYIMSHLSNSQRLIDEHTTAINHLKSDTERMKTEIHELRTQPKVFTSTKCNLTGAPLELPTVHFLSGNSYNLNSLPGGGAAADAAAAATAKTNGPAPSNKLLEDPKCGAEQQSVAEIMQKLQQNAPTVDEEFFNQLEISPDGFATVAEYFSKCLFEETPSAARQGATSSAAGMLTPRSNSAALTPFPSGDAAKQPPAPFQQGGPLASEITSGGNPFA